MADNTSELKMENRLPDSKKYELSDDPECIEHLVKALLLRERCRNEGQKMIRKKSEKNN